MEKEVEVLEDVQEVDLNSLTKKDLISLIDRKDEAHLSLMNTLEKTKEEYEGHVDELNKYYLSRINELKALINYYERKNQLVLDLLTIEKDKKEGAEND